MQRREQGGGQGMESGDTWELENGKQTRPGKGHGVLLHHREQDRLKKEWLGRQHCFYYSHMSIRGDAACRKAYFK